MSNYPAGVTDRNFDELMGYEPEPKNIDVDIAVSTSLSKSTTINTNNYVDEFWEDYEKDEDTGRPIKKGGMDRTYNNLEEDYKDNEYTILELLDILKEQSIKKMESVEDLYLDQLISKTEFLKERAIIKRIINSCSGWEEDELEVYEDEV